MNESQSHTELQSLRENEIILQGQIRKALQDLFYSGVWHGPTSRTFSQFLVNDFRYSPVIANELARQVGAILTTHQLLDSNPEIQGRIDALLTWRRSEARTFNAAAYRVLSNRSLLGIARANPSSLEELGKIHGIGRVKIEKYGDKILHILHDLRAVPPAGERTYLDTDSYAKALASAL